MRTPIYIDPQKGSISIILTNNNNKQSHVIFYTSRPGIEGPSDHRKYVHAFP